MRRSKNPHAELCDWANGLRPDSPTFNLLAGLAPEEVCERDVFTGAHGTCDKCGARLDQGCQLAASTVDDSHG